MKPIIKFNNGNGAILCNQCGCTIKVNLTKEETEGKTDLLVCQKCKDDLDTLMSTIAFGG